jgi:hypothetical protein
VLADFRTRLSANPNVPMDEDEADSGAVLGLSHSMFLTDVNTGYFDMQDLHRSRPRLGGLGDGNGAGCGVFSSRPLPAAVRGAGSELGTRG